MQTVAMAWRLQRRPMAELAEQIGVTPKALYMRLYRGRRRLSDEQRERYVKALATHGRHVRVRALSLDFVPRGCEKPLRSFI